MRGRARVDAKQHSLDALLDVVAAHYDLGHWWDVQPVGTAVRIAAEAGEFMVSDAGRRSDASLRFEAMLLNHLADKAFVAPRLVRTRAGRPWQRSTTGAAALVSEWVQGGEVDASLAPHRGRSMRALAEYHSAVRSFLPRLRAVGGPTPFALEQGGPTALEAFAGISGWYLDADGRRRLRSAASYLWRQFLHLPEVLDAGGGSLPRLIVHGDFGSAAVVLDEPSCGGRPADGLVGFDRAGYDVRVVDLAAALKAFGREAGGFDLDRCAALIADYDSVDRLSSDEIEALPHILRLERLAAVYRMTSGFVAQFEEGDDVGTVIGEIVAVAEAEVARLRWLEAHEPAFVEALGSSLVG